MRNLRSRLALVVVVAALGVVGVFQSGRGVVVVLVDLVVVVIVDVVVVVLVDLVVDVLLDLVVVVVLVVVVDVELPRVFPLGCEVVDERLRS